MKKVKLSLFALVSIAGVGGAFASAHKAPAKKLLAHTYYAIANGQSTNFSWTTTAPSLPKSCSSTSVNPAYCTVTTNQATKPAPGTFPTQAYNHSTNGNLYQ